MIIENNEIKGLQSELSHLDEVMTQQGFVRWQWEYTRATYDLKLIDSTNNEDYFLRINTRAVEGKLESPSAVLVIEDSYIGRATFPHGLDYDSEVPKSILKASNEQLSLLKSKLI